METGSKQQLDKQANFDAMCTMLGGLDPQGYAAQVHKCSKFAYTWIPVQPAALSCFFETIRVLTQSQLTCEHTPMAGPCSGSSPCAGLHNMLLQSVHHLSQWT
jgi:hypothetical protein